MPALVVPIAGYPAFSKMRALAASHAFGTSRLPLRLRSRNCDASDLWSGLLILVSVGCRSSRGCRSPVPGPLAGLGVDVGAGNADVSEFPVGQPRQCAT